MQRSSRPPLLSVLTLISAVAGFAACAAHRDAPAAAGVHFDTVAGVVHAVNEGGGAWSAGAAWRVDTAGAVKIGAVDGPDEYVFGSVGGVVVGRDGRVYVADSKAQDIRVFSPDGTFLRRFGRQGQGPGEFANVGGLGRAPGGGVAAMDGQLGRVSVFDAEGTFVRSFNLMRPYEILMDGWPVRFDDQGRYYDRTQLSTSFGVDTVGVVRYASDGRVEDTTVVAVYKPVQAVIMRNGLPRASFPVPYAARPTSIVGPRGRIYATTGAKYAVARLSPDGDTTLVIERDVVPTPVPAAERDSASARLRRIYRQVAGAEPRDLPDIPETQPPISALQVDEEGYLWVLHSAGAEKTANWDVFDPDGRLLGTVAIPAMWVMDISEHAVAGVVRDSLGVPRVEVVPLDRGGSAS